MNKKLTIPILVAATLWFLMFSIWTKHWFNFWIGISISALILMVLAIVLERDILKQFQWNWQSIGLGLLAAVVLWVVFYFGEFFSSLLFGFAREQVDGIYAMKENQNKLWIALGLFFIMGPAEEIFWRGYVQQKFIDKYGEWKGLIFATLIYALVHIWSFNFMLVMSALVCGVFWGVMYRYNKNLVPLIISHAVWDVMVFILLPIM
ncbi:MAG TPA: CPBP family intramembrane metalloprotease [Bacteroidales bacterium]|nr:CPBP family intramembrane metalloprotease [Bacteroidales bacterium]